jgi:hypothetical protein
MSETVKSGGKEFKVVGELNLSKGGKNAHFFFCDYHEQRRAYGSCLTLIDGRDTTQDTESERTCLKAMGCGSCPAVKMRRLEELAGGAVFYKPQLGTPERPYAGDESGVKPLKRVDKSGAGYRRGWQSVGRALGKEAPLVKRPPPLPVKPTAPAPTAPAPQPTMADAINKKMKELGEGA